MRVRRRHIIYLQGYDPRGLAQYYRMFRTELRKFGRLYAVKSSVTRPTTTDTTVASWTIDTAGDDWQTTTTYDFLRLEDLIQTDLAWPLWKTILWAEVIYWRLVLNGTLWRFARAHWRFAVFISYPHYVLFNEVLLTGALGWGMRSLLEWLGFPSFVSAIAGFLVFVAAFGWLARASERRTYMLYLMADTIFTWQFSHRNRPDWDERIESFARHLVRVAQDSDADEIVVVGHSSGSFLGTEMLARALELDPDLGRRRSRMMLLTIGGNLPIVGFHRASRSFREHLLRLAVEPTVDWIDCQSRKDVMNFFPFDPIAAHGLDPGPAARNPRIWFLRLRDLVDPARYNVFRWKFFRVHFQFVMANERPNAYDFFAIVCGPVPLKERFDHPDAALATLIGSPGDSTAAWAELDPPAPAPAG